MVDIARLGFAVASDALKQGKVALDALTGAARKTQDATDSLNASTERTDSAVKQAASGTLGLGNRLSWFAGVLRNGNNGVLSFSKGLTSVPGAADQAASSLNRLGRAASDNINRMQATPGNIAAQFQDIGVTAAGGMSPMLIALQQGTQLSAALAGGMGNLAGAFKQLFSVTAIMTIGFVALLAAFIQSVDWAKQAAGAMEWLASVMVEAAPYAVALAAGLLLINAPAILTGVVALTKAMYGLAAGLLAAVGIPALIVIGLVAIVAAAVHFRKELTEILGFDIVQAAHDGVNLIIGFFVGGYNGIKAVWSKLPSALGDLTIQAANATLRAIDNMVNGTINRINGLMKQLPFGVGDNLQMGNLEFGQQSNPYAGAAAGVGQIVTEAVRAGQKIDYVGKGIKLARDYAKQGAAYLKGWAKDLRAGDPDKADGGGSADAAAKGGKTEAEKWADLLKGADGQMRGLEQAGAQIGVYGEALSRLKFEQELFNKAQDAGIKLTADMTAELKRRAGEMAVKDTKNTHDAFVEGLIQSGDAQSRALDMQRTALGLTGQALDSYTYSQTILNDALNKHIALSPAEIAAIKQMGDVYAQAKAGIDAQTEALKRQQEQLKFTKETIKGVFTEWVANVRNGQSVFTAFADSVLNALNKIIDKALDMALNGMLDSIFGGASMGAGGGMFSGLFGGGGGLSGNSAAAAAGASADFSPIAFAKGGIVDSPTMFKFAKGTGLMGEAGPEAIMPLKRGANGALGVQMHDGGRGGSQPPSVTIAGSTYNIGGVTTPAEIMSAIRQGDEQSKAELARAIPALLSEYQRNGTTG